MRGISETTPESYGEYRTRKEGLWKDSIKSIMTEIKDSSLKEEDKSAIQLMLIRILLR